MNAIHKAQVLHMSFAWMLFFLLRVDRRSMKRRADLPNKVLPCMRASTWPPYYPPRLIGSRFTLLFNARPGADKQYVVLSVYSVTSTTSNLAI